MPRHSYTKDRINNLTFEEINPVVQRVDSLKAVFEHLEVRSYRAPNYDHLRSKLDELGVDYSHIGRGATWITKNGPTAARKARLSKRPHEEVFTECSTLDRGSIKNRILKDNLMPYICNVCGNEGEWQGKPLTLTLDHINGINDDNRLENLRFLCPNCDTQTDTYGSKNIKNLKQREPL